MNECFYKIKKYIQIVIFLLNLISFIVITIIYNKNRTNYSEYTTLSKYSTNFLIIIIFLILLIHTTCPEIICSFLKNELEYFMTDKGKIVANISIGIMFWSCDDIPILVFEIINFVSSFALFLCEFVFQCKILKNKTEMEVNEEKKSKNISFETKN